LTPTRTLQLVVTQSLISHLTALVFGADGGIESRAETQAMLLIGPEPPALLLAEGPSIGYLSNWIRRGTMPNDGLDRQGLGRFEVPSLSWPPFSSAPSSQFERYRISEL
jgi:hypothetical protein